jgi:TPR repeat protein
MSIQNKELMMSVVVNTFARFGRVTLGLLAIAGVAVASLLIISPPLLVANEQTEEAISNFEIPCDVVFDSYPMTGNLSAAENGNPEEQYRVGNNYALGECGRKTDRAEAIHWLSKAAEQGHVLAQL